jgi:hypothetical protein
VERTISWLLRFTCLGLPYDRTERTGVRGGGLGLDLPAAARPADSTALAVIAAARRVR